MNNVSPNEFWSAMKKCRTAFHETHSIPEEMIFTKGLGQGEIVDGKDGHNLFMVALWKREFRLAKCLHDAGCAVNLHNNMNRNIFQSILRGSTYNTSTFSQDFEYAVLCIKEFSPVAHPDCTSKKDMPAYLKNFFSWSHRMYGLTDKKIEKSTDPLFVFDFCFGGMSGETLEALEFTHKIMKIGERSLFKTQYYQLMKAKLQSQEIYSHLEQPAEHITSKQARKM